MNVWNGVDDARALALRGDEVWMPVSGTAKRYWVSNLGRVKSDVRSRGLRDVKPTVMNSGYRSVGITRAEGAESSTQLVHRLVVLAFDGPAQDADQTDVRHLDGGQEDNRLCNLAWGTRSENMKDVLAHRRPAVEDRERAERETTWYQGKTMDASLLAHGIEFYDAKKLTIADLAHLWECTPDVAANIVRGETRRQLALPETARANGRKGESHAKAVCSDERLADAFRLYVKNHWSSNQFADHLGIQQGTAASILSGRSRNNIPRPEGFQYPWPDSASLNRRAGEEHGCAKTSEAEILSVFARIESGELTNMKQVQAELGTSRGVAYSIVAGRSWKHLERSESLKAAIDNIQRSRPKGVAHAPVADDPESPK